VACSEEVSGGGTLEFGGIETDNILGQVVEELDGGPGSPHSKEGEGQFMREGQQLGC
jgi:hypothetical protein